MNEGFEAKENTLISYSVTSVSKLESFLNPTYHLRISVVKIWLSFPKDLRLRVSPEAGVEIRAKDTGIW